MLKQVTATIKKHNMLVPGDRVLVGVSGGPDSVALLHAMQYLSRELGIEIMAAHLNHSLRGQDSEDDAAYVRRLADELAVPAVIENRDVARYVADRGLSVQEGAREVRYGFFEAAARQMNCNKLATGHNANDQAETVLNHFLRGSGSGGLGGIPPVRDGWVIRPLIETPRSLIEQYCRENGLEPRTDKSNLKTVYTRNRIRLELIPYLEKEYNQNLVETLVRMSEIFREDEHYFQHETVKYWDEVVKTCSQMEIVFDAESFSGLPGAIQKRLIRRGWEVLTGTVHNLGYSHLIIAIDMINNARTGSSMNLPMGVRLTKSYNEATLSRIVHETGAKEGYQYQLQVPGVTEIPEAGVSIIASIVSPDTLFTPFSTQEEIMIDLELTGIPLFVRNRREGDWFKPAGMNGSKKVKKFLIDSKIPRIDREILPIVVSAAGDVIWVTGLRADGRWLAGASARQAIRLKIVKNLQNKN